jgi:F-type H+-transporting ATPase subunit b
VSRKTRARARAAASAAIGSIVLLTASHAFAAGGSLEIFPQIDLLIPLLVLFAALVIPVNRLVFKPLFRVLDERAERIEGARARAARLQQEADEIVEQYEAALRATREDSERARREQLDGARRDTLDTTGAARAEAEGEVEAARRALRESLETARTTLRAQSRELAREAASRVLGRAV